MLAPLMNDPELLLTTSKFRVIRESVTSEGGKTKTREIIRHPGACVIVPLLDDGRVCLIRNWRIAAGQTLIELPAGTLEPPEPPHVTAERELIEETGYRARSWKKIASFWPSPGYVSEQMTIFLARDLTEGEAAPMHDEKIETRWFAKNELDGLIGSGKIQDGKTLIGFMHWRCYRPKR